MTTALANQPVIDPAVIAQVLIKGDLRSLTPAQKVDYYLRVCESVGLNPLTQPFAYMVLNGREVLYAKKECSEQLRSIHQISIDPKGFAREVIEGVYVVTAPASLPSGRTDVSTGAVAIDGLKGENRANAMMKAETKAKRRVTLSICGLGMLDETEAEQFQPVSVVPQVTRVEVPEGAFQILNVTRVSEWVAEITYVDHLGVEDTLPMALDAKGGALILAEECQQDQSLVVLTRVIGKRDKKRKIGALARFKPIAEALTDALDNAALDAEIVAREAAKESDIPF